MQPLISEAFELSTAVDTQLKVLKEYAAFAQTKGNEASATIVQELVKKEQATENIMRGLNKQFVIFTDKVRLPEEQQSVLGRATGESQGPVGARTLTVPNFGNCANFVEVVSGVTTQNSLRGVEVESKSSFCNKPMV